jgi:hypothetical protein
MTPNHEGRYCNSCAKTVTDFTLMTDEEIQHFLFNHKRQAICGHFKTNQVHRIVIDLPGNISTIKMPAWMKFLVACLLIFGISMFPFETTIAGKPVSEISFYQGEPILNKKDSVPKLKKSLRPDEAVETNEYVDGGILPIKFENKPKKNKPKPDSITNCKPKDSLKNDSLKTDLVKELIVPEQKKKTGQKEKTSIEFISPALLKEEETNMKTMD